MQYCIGKRMEAAKLLLKENRHSISEIADIVGYEDHSAFTRAFRPQRLYAQGMAALAAGLFLTSVAWNFHRICIINSRI
jgi:methylphosphotriester-DNA--protein-cysteine methyltransferase